MSGKKWVVDLSEAERCELLALTRKGKIAAQRLRRAHILLHADEGRADEAIAVALHTNRSTVERTRRRFVEEGLEAALSDRPRPGAAPVLDAKGRATLLALILVRRRGEARRRAVPASGARRRGRMQPKPSPATSARSAITSDHVVLWPPGRAPSVFLRSSPSLAAGRQKEVGDTSGEGAEEKHAAER